MSSWLLAWTWRAHTIYAAMAPHGKQVFCTLDLTHSATHNAMYTAITHKNHVSKRSLIPKMFWVYNTFCVTVSSLVESLPSSLALLITGTTRYMNASNIEFPSPLFSTHVMFWLICSCLSTCMWTIVLLCMLGSDSVIPTESIGSYFWRIPQTAHATSHTGAVPGESHWTLFK